MKLVLFGASGMIGSRILTEALRRGHAVTVAARDPAKFKSPKSDKGSVTVVPGDVLDSASVAKAAKGQDAAVSAYGPGVTGDAKLVATSTNALIEGLDRAGTKRFIMVGGAGSLEGAPGKRVVDSPQFPKEWLGIALAHCDALAVLKKSTNLDWSYFSPAAMISPGERTGKFRVQGTQLVVDSKGESKISCEDYAVALLDELEKPKYVKKQFTVGY